MDSNKELIEALKCVVNNSNWQNIGHIDTFKQMKCYRLYCVDEIDQDVVLVKNNKNKFFALDARCSHEGGPLDEGDIEEINEKLVIVCPWHSFDFDLGTGISSTGLKQQTYEIRVIDDHVYIHTSAKLSLNKQEFNENFKPLNNIQEQTIPKSLQENDEKCLKYWAVKVLCTADPMQKVDLTYFVAEKWNKNELEVSLGNYTLPEQPYRLDNLKVLDPGKIKRGKGGTLASRIALLHSLANIEQWAIDLSWDIVARYSNLEYPDKTKLPKEFYSDWLKVACDEAKHFVLLDKRLKELDSYFGALAVHNGLWESAITTKDNFLARLAVVHMVHEARGLDVHPQTRLRFNNQNDAESVKVLDILYNDEITHVAAGMKWFKYSCDKYKCEEIETFHSLVKQYFKGYLKPPFDTEGRKIAGMDVEWYMPLIKSS